MFRALRSPFTAKFFTGGLALLGVTALAWALTQDVKSPGFLRAQTATPGALTCWGNDYGYVPPAGNWMDVTVGWTHACAIRAADSIVACWGDNDYGQTNAPAGRFQKIDAGTAHTCGIKEDGSVACWGTNTHGESNPPAGRFTDITASLRYSCGIREDGTIVCWGEDTKGQLSAPAGTFVQLTAEGNHGCALKADGTVLCWGENVSGSTTPPAGTFRLVEAGYSYTCGIKTDDTLKCWGHGGEGQTTAPTGAFSDVDLGTNHACGLRQNGTIVCWGMNVGGQANPPAGTFTDLAVGLYHGCAIGVSAGNSSSSAPSASITGSVQVPASVPHGSTIVYRVMATNNGSQALSQVVVYLQSAAVNTFDASLSDARCVGGTAEQSVANCTIASLAVGQSVTVDVGFRLGPSLTCSAVINSTVSVRSTTPATVWNSELLLIPVICASSSSSAPTSSCTDSDGGQNLDVAGTVTSVTCSGFPPTCTTETHTDYCDDRPGYEDDIVEYFCGGATTTSCLNGKICRDGACVTASSSSIGGQCTVGMQYGQPVSLTAAREIKASWAGGDITYVAYRKDNKDIFLSRVQMQGLTALKATDARIATNGAAFDVVGLAGADALVVYEDQPSKRCKASLVRWPDNTSAPVIGAPVDVPTTTYNSWCTQILIARPLEANKVVLFWGIDTNGRSTRTAAVVATVNTAAGTISFGPVSQEFNSMVLMENPGPFGDDTGKKFEVVVRTPTSLSMIGRTAGAVVARPRWFANLFAWSAPASGGYGSPGQWVRDCTVGATVTCDDQTTGAVGRAGPEVSGAKVGTNFLIVPIYIGSDVGVGVEGKGTNAVQRWGGTALPGWDGINARFYSILPLSDAQKFIVTARDPNGTKAALGRVGSSNITWTALSLIGGKVAIRAGDSSKFLFFNYPDSNQTGQTTMMAGQYTDSCPTGPSSSSLGGVISSISSSRSSSSSTVSVPVVISSSSRSSSSVITIQGGSSSVHVSAVCGNFTLESGEQCEVGVCCGGSYSCDTRTCLCTPLSQVPTQNSACGNFKIEAGEDCENGITTPQPPCTGTAVCNTTTCRCPTGTARCPRWRSTP